MNTDTIIQLVQLVLTVLGLVFIWFQIYRSRKDAITGSFITSLAERWLAIEDRRMNIKDDDIKVYYKFLVPELENILKVEHKNNLKSFANDFIFNEEDRKVQDKEKIFNIIMREYADADAVFNYTEEEYLVGKHLNLVDKKLWDYWEYYLKFPFKSVRMRRYWNLRLKVGAAYPGFVEFVEKNYLA